MAAETKTVALIGSEGMLAKMIRERAPQEYALHLYDLPEFDITDRELVVSTLQELSPDIILNCAAYTNVDGAESEPDLAKEVNGVAVGYMAEAALVTDAILVHVSTDYVFDGQKNTAYLETDEVNPQSVYGQTKLHGEQSITSSQLNKYFIVRTSWLYGPGGGNFVETILRLANEREELEIISDQVGCPTYTADLADAIFNLLGFADHHTKIIDHSPYGIYHFANKGTCSWHEFACAIVDEARQQKLPLKVSQVNAIDTKDYPLPAQRPANSVFNKSKYQRITGASIPEWRESLHRYILMR